VRKLYDSTHGKRRESGQTYSRRSVSAFGLRPSPSPYQEVPADS